MTELLEISGNRAWRKWGKRNGAGRGAMASYRVFRRHRDSTFAGVEGMRPAPLPAREFSPRSLVGMTMSARKRAARVEDIAIRWSWNHEALERNWECGAFPVHFHLVSSGDVDGPIKRKPPRGRLPGREEPWVFHHL